VIRGLPWFDPGTQMTLHEQSVVTRRHRVIAAFFGAVETSALFMGVIALWSMRGEGLQKLLAAFIFLKYGNDIVRWRRWYEAEGKK